MDRTCSFPLPGAFRRCISTITMESDPLLGSESDVEK